MSTTNLTPETLDLLNRHMDHAHEMQVKSAASQNALQVLLAQIKGLATRLENANIEADLLRTMTLNNDPATRVANETRAAEIVLEATKELNTALWNAANRASDAKGDASNLVGRLAMPAHILDKNL